MKIIKQFMTFTTRITPALFIVALMCQYAFAGGKEPDKSRAYEIKDLVQYANPICGTGDNINTFPGAVAPFGMIQWSPDTGPRRIGGYNYADSVIYGFSLDHLSGAGCPDGGDFAFVPTLGTGEISPFVDRSTFPASFSHADETAKPGYYGVKLDNGIRVQLTCTVRSGFGRFTYPDRGTPTMVINAASNINGVTRSMIHIDPAHRSISGLAESGSLCNGPTLSRIYFYAVFNRPFERYGTWGDFTVLKGWTNSEGKQTGAYVTFSKSGGRTVLVKVALSYVSIADAKANLEAENPLSAFTSKDFDKAVAAARNTWNRWLNKIQVTGGTMADMKTFYSMLYHTLIAPSVCSDVNGRYFGYDGKIHTTSDGRVQYTYFSGWDIYRSECQLLAMIAPRQAGDMAQSLLRDYQQGGTFPRWAGPGGDDGVMMGDPAAPIIAGFYAFGARDFDVKAALAGLVRAATDPGVRAPRTRVYERDALGQYLKLGYVPENQHGGYGNVSMSLEYNSDDFALSRFAESLGDKKDAGMLLKHAGYWRNLFNSKTGYIQMRRSDGQWAPGFSDSVEVYDKDQAYVEGTAAQYVWMVPFDLKGLARMMGGDKIASARLDTFFTKLDAGFNPLNGVATGIYANLGNEPCLETPWIYAFLGRPYKTQQVVRRAIMTLYSDKPDGFPGNDDLGEMSSWYIFSALGMYPELPGSDVLVLGSPLFDKAVLHLRNGDVTIIGKDAGDTHPYVHGLSLNGKDWHKPGIRFSDISHGGTLVYDLSGTPDTKWGSAPQDAPPSYGDK